jgi:hypothetical protein
MYLSPTSMKSDKTFSVKHVELSMVSTPFVLDTPCAWWFEPLGKSLSGSLQSRLTGVPPQLSF